MGNPHSLKRQGWNYTIRWFSVISRTLVVGDLTILQICSQCILQPQLTGLFCFVFFCFKLVHNTSQTAININREWSEGSTCNRIVCHWFQKFFSGDTKLEDQEGRGHPSAIDDQHLKTLEQDLVKVSEKCLRHWVSAFQQYQIIQKY